MGSHFHSWHYCTSCFLWARLAHASLEPIQHVIDLVTFAKAQWMGGWTSGCKGWTSGCCFTESCDSYPRPKLYTKKRPKRSKKMIQSIYLFGQVPQNLGNPDKNGALLYGGRTPSKLTKHRPLKLTWNTEIN